MKQNLLVFTLFLIIGVTLRAEPSQTQGDGTPNPRQTSESRMAVVTPALFEVAPKQVTEWLENFQKEKRRKPTDKEPNRKQKFDRLQQGKREPIDREPPSSDAFLLQFAYRIFPRVLESRLKVNRSGSIVSTDLLLAAIHRLKLTREQCFTVKGAKLISKELGFAQILLVNNAKYTIKDGTDRVLTFRAELRELSFDGMEQGEAHFTEGFSPLCGVGIAGRSVLSGVFNRSPLALLTNAVAQSANRLEHTLRVGEVMPLLEPETKIALFPILAPTTADRLLFSTEGRILRPKSLQGLPADVSLLFHPNLLPLTSASTLNAGVVQRRLNSANMALENLWNQAGGLPIKVVQEIGKGLKVDYMLLARITHLEVAGSLPKDTNAIPVALQQGEAAKEIVFQVNAEARGLLVRVKDGAVLWQDNGESRFALHADQIRTTRRLTERDMVQSTTRFALLRLEQSLFRYFAVFEN